MRLLGALELRNGNIVIHSFGERAQLLLFARLALEPRATHPRLALARAIWPERADDEAWLRNSLRRRLSDLVARLEPPGFAPARAIESVDDNLRLNAAAFDIDVDRFERHARQGQWQAARDAYSGELLPGVEDERVAQRRAGLAARLALVDAQLGQPAPWLPPEEDADELAPVAPDPRGILPYTSQFFGRADEVEHLGALVAVHRLVVVHGPPGCGKSRLVSEAGKTEFGSFVERFHAGLEHCRNSRDVIEQVRCGVGVDLGKKEVIELIATKLRSRRVLIVLDDFEQVAGAGGNAALDMLLAALPLAHLVVTTRRRLRRRDPQGLDLGPLPLPAEGASLEEALASPAVALFANRARAARTHFKVHGRNRAIVVAICRHLEGMPLALQLAAALVHRCTLPVLLEEVQRSTLLLARAAHRDERHPSVETALHLSWRLLGLAEQRLLRALAVFRGGFTVAQAELVSGVGRVGAVLQALARDALLVAQATGSGAPRLGLQVAVREFAERQQTGAEAALLRGRHRELFARLALDRLRQHEWPATDDMPNLFAAMANALDDDEPATAARLALALARPWRARGATGPELQLIERTARAATLRPRPRVLLLSLLATLLVNAGRGEQALAHAEKALVLAGRDAVLRAEALLAQAGFCWLAAQDAGRAFELLQQVGHLLPGSAPPDLHARFLLLRGALALQHEGDAAAAKAMAQRVERLYSQRGDRHGMLLALPLRTAVLLVGEDFDAALRVCEAGIRSAEALGETLIQLQLLNRKALALEARRRCEEALAVLQQQARLAISRGATYHAAYAVWNQCQPLVDAGRFEEAAILMGFSHQYWVRQFGGFSDYDHSYVKGVRDAVTREAGAATWRRGWTRGKALPEGDGLDHACGTPAAG